MIDFSIKGNKLIKIKSFIDQRKKYEEKQDKILKDWEQDREHTKYYNKKFIDLENAIDILYRYYYEDIHAILTNEEINQIQREINYNFMSDKFYNKMVEKLESKEV